MGLRILVVLEIFLMHFLVEEIQGNAILVQEGLIYKFRYQLALKMLLLGSKKQLILKERSHVGNVMGLEVSQEVNLLLV